MMIDREKRRVVEVKGERWRGRETGRKGVLDVDEERWIVKGEIRVLEVYEKKEGVLEVDG
jgi:hypothetical protein